MIGAGHRRRSVVDRGEKGHLGARRFAGELGRGDGLHDPPRVDQLARRVELLDPVEKEGPLLGEEERGAWIEDELAGIGFDLREIRMEGAVERQVVVQLRPPHRQLLRPSARAERLRPRGRQRHLAVDDALAGVLHRLNRAVGIQDARITRSTSRAG